MNREAPNVTLAQLRTLLAVVEGGSFTEAALELDLNQSTVSHAVAGLETALGARLLERGRHGARPTDLGRRVVAHAREALAAIEALGQEAALARGELRGTVRVASVRSAATLLLPPVIGRFRAAHPGVRFEVLDLEAQPGGIEGALLDGRADLGLLSLPTAARLPSWELARDEYVLLWPDDGRKIPPTWEEIEARPWIVCDMDCAARLRAHWAAHTRALSAAYTVREDSVILSMVANGLGVSALPRLAAEPLPPGVRAFPLPAPLERRLGVAVAPGRASAPIVAAFLRALRAAHPSPSSEREAGATSAALQSRVAG